MTAEELKSLRERAWAIYNADIKQLVEPEHKGKYLVLDVTTGHYEIDENLAQADLRMLAKRRPPKGETPPFLSFRIGYPTTFDRPV